MALENHPMWRLPRHHLDQKEVHEHVHWVELFYDLIHVVIIFLLGNYLSDHLSVDGFFTFAVLFVAIWFAWADSSVFNSLYVSTDVKHRLIMSCQIVTAMVMAASIPHVTGKGWQYFALAYAANRLITAYLYHRTNRLGVETTKLARGVSRNFFLLAIVFATSAFVPAPYRYWLLGMGIVAIQLLYMVPKIGILENKRFLPRLGHMSERFALLLLIVVGEGFFKLVVTLSDKGIYKVDPSILVNFIFGGIAVFVQCWIYFDFVGNGKPKSQAKWTLVNWWLAHLFLMLSAIMIGVALAGEVKAGFWEPYPLKYGVIGCLGLASYLLCLLWIQFNIETRVAHRFATPKVRMVGVALALFTLAVLPHVPSIVGNLLWGSALISQIAIPVTRAYFTFIKEEQAQGL
ncbi:low temperature requirement protein A [Kangiella geojedonensis]|uniref:Membrane protein n=1 Tax=Kangiella geojedonensis TaxID=914150 RepID=A0A0F6RCH1_9GAMM|nr:low temperature requirement protein A [Kangiella geojedonensis]AKE52046.1 membrane protein [Kangiella geojedonensis]